jgi:hypothetical protein
MANQTIQNTIDYVQTFIEYAPVNVGTANEPAITISNQIQNLVMGAPFGSAWNRKEDSSTSTVKGTQDYTIALTDFAWLEKVSLTDPAGRVWEVIDVYNNLPRGVADPNKPGRPTGCCVLVTTYGTSIKIRFMGVPDQVYLITLTYQKLWAPIAALTGGTGTWAIPQIYSDVYNALWLGEAYGLSGDTQNHQVYRMRGVAALIARTEGLTEMQINAFLEQFERRTGQAMYRQGSVQQSIQAKGAQ